MKTIWIINQYASTPETGVGGRSYYFAKELSKRGHRVYLIASASSHLLRKQPSFNSQFKLEKTASFTFVWLNMPHYFEAHSKQRIFNWFLFSWRLRNLPNIISNHPDVLIYSSPSLIPFLGAQRLAKRFRSRLVFEVRDIWPLTLTEIGRYSTKNLFIRFMQWIEDKAYRDSDYVVSNLKNAIEHMTNQGMAREKFTWIPNGYSQAEVNEPVIIDDSTLSLIPHDKFIIGYTGTFGLANDLYNLLDAAEKLKINSEIVFVLVGRGKDKDNLINYARTKELTNVVFIDFIEKKQIQSMLSHFDVLVVGSKKEPMYQFGVSPNKLYDYLIASKPIIYYIESGDYHPVKDANCGFEIEPGNSEKLAAAVLQLYSMPIKQRKKMGENGLHLATEKYEYGKLTEQLCSVIFDRF